MKRLTLKTNLLFALTLAIPLFTTSNCFEPDNLKASYLEEAKRLLPELIHQTSYPVSSIKIEKDVQVWFGWKAITVSSARELANIKLAKGEWYCSFRASLSN